MGKYFILLIVGIIMVMGGLGWYVLGQDRDLEMYGSTTDTTTQDPIAGHLDNLDQQELLRIANDANSPERVDAIFKLIDVEQKPETLVPALAIMLFDRNQLVGIAAGIVLKKIGVAGAEHLRTMMESDDVEQNVIACSALKEMGGANLYEPQIKQWLLSNDSNARKRALFALQGSNEGVLELMEPILGTLEDPDFNVQCMACRVLVNLGPDAIDATEKVLELHKNGNPSSRSWAAIALGAIGPNTRLDTADFLAGTLDAFMQIEKQRSLQGLAKMGPEALKVADQVREVMRDKQKRVMPDAAFTLWKITGETVDPLKVLAAGLKDPSSVDDTLELVGKMQEAAKPLVGTIISILETPEESSKELAVIALGNIGPAAIEALPAIKRIAANKDCDAVIRFYAREAIEKISTPK